MMDRKSLLFDSAYNETLQFANGQSGYLRLLRPDDKERMRQGLARMSKESRHLRFMGAPQNLSDRIIAKLCDVDGTNHFAIGALHTPEGGDEQGIGVGRFVRLQDDTDTADVAITVIDEFQKQGLGKLLLRRLLSAARERGIKRARCDFFAYNRKVWWLLAPYREGADLQVDNNIVSMTFDLPPQKLLDQPSASGRKSQQENISTRTPNNTRYLH